ncbi:MAG: glycosyltransferase, partial [Caulobacterales bacterium]
NEAKLDLVIVGKPGWRYASILEAMAPHVRTGALHHLQNVPLVELQALYRGAEAVLFPSYAEGFGLPTIEALAAGTPPIVSDIPAHRYVLGDAALFVDPYDVQAIAEAIERLVLADDRETLRRQILDKAPAIVDRYRPARVGAEWADLFDRLSPRSARR